MSTQTPLIQPLAGIIQVGAAGGRREFNRAAVFPPDRNGMMCLALFGGGKGQVVSIDLTREQAELLAMRIMAAITESQEP